MLYNFINCSEHSFPKIDQIEDPESIKVLIYYYCQLNLTNMQTNLLPIQKHKSQIEKRITLLEQKFKEKEMPRENVKKLRDLIQDENKLAYNQPIPSSKGQAVVSSKTVEVRGKIRTQLDTSKVKKQAAYQPSYAGRQPLVQADTARHVKQEKQQRENKDEKISELYNMMRSILQGQKNIEKELSQLKKQQLKDSAKRVKKQQTSLLAAQKQTANHSIIDNLSRSKEKYGERSNQKQNQQTSNPKQVSRNQSFLLQENQEPTKAKDGKTKKEKTKKAVNFEHLLGELRGKEKNGERICVGEQWKGRIWSEVEERVKESEKQYKDTIHRNNKHEFQHLMSTFQLQRKLKDDLIGKVYQQCNSQIYK